MKPVMARNSKAIICLSPTSIKSFMLHFVQMKSLKLEEGLTNIGKTIREIELDNILSSTLKKLNDATIRGKRSTN